MGNKRVYEFAKEISRSNKDVVDKAQSLGIDVANHMSSLSDADENKLRKGFSQKQVDRSATSKQPANRPVNQSTETKGKTILQGKSSLNNPKFQNRKVNNPNRGPQGVQKPKAAPAKSANPAAKEQAKTVPAEGRPERKDNNVNKQKNQTQSRKTTEAPRNNQGSTQQKRPNNNGARPAQNGAKSQARPAQGDKPQNRTNDNRGQNRSNQSDNRNQARTQNTRSTRPAQESANQGTRSNNSTNNNSNYRGNNNSDNQNRSTQGSKDKKSYGSNNRGNSYGNNNQNRNRFNKKGKKGRQQPASQKPAVPPRKFRELPEVLEYTEGMNVADISKKIYREPAEIIKKLFMMGVMVNQNQALGKDTIELLAADYGIDAQEKVQIDIADLDRFFEPEAADEAKLVSRPPVVTIMGHVDHGKTTLLDTLRHSRVTSGEAGGITQHIGAYQIEINGKPITFLDTPGHAAFTSMRARGASITDITILVVAADDGVMPQTVEAINHAKAAKVPIIVAVNKIDKPGANPQHVMQELSEYELIPEAWGGDTIFVEISAKFNQNIDELLEMILLVAEVEDLKADPTQRAIGTVIEARLDKGKGPVATLLVQQGTLKVGDPIVVGDTFGRVRVMTNDIGRRDKAAGPATPVEITGLNDVPQAGDHFVVFEDEKTARAAGEERAKRALMEHRSVMSRVTLDNLFESLKEGELKEVNVIIKADVQGSAEALAASLQKIEVAGVRVKIVHSAVGAINESDVTLAAASNAIIIGFNVRPTAQAKQQAEAESVDIRLHRIIYKAIEEIETAMKGMLDPEFQEKITGQMIVRETYKVSKVGTIAGCYVTEGSIQRDSGVRIIRDGIVILEGKLASLKRFKDDVKEVKLGFECGAMIENFNDVKVDDVIEGFIMEEIKN